jgi:hypothetical protein
MSRPRRYAANDCVIFTPYARHQSQQRATVSAVHPDGSVDLTLDDGTQQYVIPPDRLKPAPKD